MNALRATRNVRHARLYTAVAVSALLAAACGDDAGSGSPDAGPDTGEEVADNDAPDGASPDEDSPDVDVPIEVPPAPEGGVTARFALGDRLQTGGGFFDFPYPSDARLTADGFVDLSGMLDRTNSALVRDLLEAAQLSRGFPTLSVGWFGFSDDVATLDLDTVHAGDASIWLVNVDAASPRWGERFPVVARTMVPDPYVDEHVIAVAAVPGFTLEPATQYAYIILRTLGDASGAPLGVPESLWAILHGGTSGDVELDALLRPLRDTLDQVGLEPSAVAAATVFTTADAVAEMYAISEGVREAYQPQILSLQPAPGRGLGWEGYCEFHGSLTLPQFQRGQPPFPSEGLFELDADGMPIAQRDETIPVVVTIPREPMPAAGYPLIMYYHGSGGISTQLVDRGLQPGPGEPIRVGEGPAWVVAQRGFAMAGSAHPVNPERVPNATAIEYINLTNLKAFRDTFRQGIIEQRLYLDALLRLELPSDLVEACDGASLPDGVGAGRFDPDTVYAMGQSMGGMYTNMIAAVEPRITAVVPTGAGGFWSFFILQTELIPNVESLLRTFIRTDVELTFVHPALHALQTAWEPAEPVVYVPHLAQRPLPGHPVRPVYQPVGLGDSFFPPSIFDVITVAYGNERAGDLVWGTMDATLALDGRSPLAGYPVTNNLTSLESSEPYTGVVVQYEGDGFSDPHVIFVQLEAVKYQYLCFFDSMRRNGSATVPGPGTLADACP